MDYARAFVKALQTVKDEGRYRVFADIRRNRGHFPSARHFAAAGPRQITVWCSNDYLGMAQHPTVIAAMHEALDTAGAGSGGTRNISGTSHYHVELEAELADLHRKEAALLFTSAYVANDTTLATLQKLLAVRSGSGATTTLPTWRPSCARCRAIGQRSSPSSRSIPWTATWRRSAPFASWPANMGL